MMTTIYTFSNESSLYRIAQLSENDTYNNISNMLLNFCNICKNRYYSACDKGLFLVCINDQANKITERFIVGIRKRIHDNETRDINKMDKSELANLKQLFINAVRNNFIAKWNLNANEWDIKNITGRNLDSVSEVIQEIIEDTYRAHSLPNVREIDALILFYP